MMSLAGRLLDHLITWIEGWFKLKTLKTQGLINLEERKITGEIEWDIESMRASATSWKDEWWTILISVPLVLVFIPGYAPVIEAGFEALKTSVPEWYVGAVGVSVAASFGFKKFGTKFLP